MSFHRGYTWLHSHYMCWHHLMLMRCPSGTFKTVPSFVMERQPFTSVCAERCIWTSAFGINLFRGFFCLLRHTELTSSALFYWALEKSSKTQIVPGICGGRRWTLLNDLWLTLNWLINDTVGLFGLLMNLSLWTHPAFYPVSPGIGSIRWMNK